MSVLGWALHVTASLSLPLLPSPVMASASPSAGRGVLPLPKLWELCLGSPLTFCVPRGCSQAFISVVLSKLALLGAASCFVLSGVGLTNGPLCFYNTTELGLRHGALWGYPFLDAIDQGPDAR